MNQTNETKLFLAEGVPVGGGRPLFSWAQVNLGVELHGVISSADGKLFLESDINQPKLEESGMLAASLVGGMISSTVLTLAVIPAIYALVKQWRLNRGVE